MSEPLLRLENIVKDFPGVRALSGVNLELRSSEILALCGENGAGKSTLMKVLSGVWPYPTYEGRIVLNGSEVRFKSTKEAEAAGIAIIHQELNLIPELSVAENILLDREPTNRLGLIDWDATHRRAEKLLSRLGLQEIRAGEAVKDLSVGKQQLVEIAKALSLNASILVLDEPTSALSKQETEDLFRILGELRSQGTSMIYISHKLDEIRRIADRIAVLRDGSSVGGSEQVAAITDDQLIQRMVGRELKELYPPKTSSYQGQPGAAPALDVKSFSLHDPENHARWLVRDVSFQVNKGEILGISGLMGSGRSELVLGIFGAFGRTEGTIKLEGKPYATSSPARAMSSGIALVTEDRKRSGLVLGQSVAFNLTLPSIRIFSNSLGLVKEDEEEKTCKELSARLSIKTPSLDATINNLSGGNQQKAVIGKWLITPPKLLILDEPTRGIDVGAKYEIYKLIRNLAASGCAIIMVSSELPEILGISDRVLVMREGRAAGCLDVPSTDSEGIMKLSMGATC